MKIDIIGCQHVDYFSKKANRQIVGDKLFYTFSDRNVNGFASDSLYIPASSGMKIPSFFPCAANAYFNRYGQLDSLELSI